MLVLCVGMYRACSTWQYGVASRILERHRAGVRLGFVEGIHFDSKVEPDRGERSWRILKAHEASDRYGDELAEGRALGIYSYRDLRDVVFSYMHKTGSSFEQLLAGQFFDLCLENDRFWRSRPGVLVQSYESLIHGPVRGVFEIAGHLGVELLEGEAEEIAESLSFEANRKKTADLTARLEAEGQRLSAEDQSRFDPVSLLHWNHIRNGGAGTWRELATPRQRAIMARVFGPWLLENGDVPDEPLEVVVSDAEFLRATRRRSYAKNQEDVILERLFAGRKGTYLVLDAAEPVRGNATYYFYQRGWRGVHVGTRNRPLHEFVKERDFDRVLAIEPAQGDSTRRASSRALAALIEEHKIAPPDIVMMADESDPVSVLLGLPLATWRPKVFLIDASGSAESPPAWEPTLLWHGYRFAIALGENRVYLREDFAGSIGRLNAPVDERDNFEPVYSAEELSSIRPAPIPVPELLPVPEVVPASIPFADFLRERDAWQREREVVQGERGTIQRERDMIQIERDARQAERDMIQRERDSRQAERDMVQQERDSRQAERDMIQRERDSRQAERDMVQQERDARQHERNEVQRERDMIQIERDSRQIERDAVQRERDLIQREREAFQAERDRLFAERAAGLAELSEVRRQIDRLELEIGRLNGLLQQERLEADAARRASEADRARDELDRAALERRAIEAERMHRPYRLIDRYGVVSAIHRRAARTFKAVRS